ncbi:hypothetical protein QE250_10935, partial [Chromatiaceae bacterium AAb-1]|nr:hypothetical protein [Chromatiaceae bacterium AAb-1]
YTKFPIKGKLVNTIVILFSLMLGLILSSLAALAASLIWITEVNYSTETVALFYIVCSTTLRMT